MALDTEKELVQYYIVNEQLTMSKGKLSAQIAHAATIAAVNCIDDPLFKKWFMHEQKKITLRAKEKELIKLEKLGFFAVRDAGYTEIPANSLTVVALPPMTREDAKIYVKRFQLMKG